MRALVSLCTFRNTNATTHQRRHSGTQTHGDADAQMRRRRQARRRANAQTKADRQTDRQANARRRIERSTQAEAQRAGARASRSAEVRKDAQTNT
eukprot:6761582-Alexandrium_andersonii.AAC.1